MYAACIQKEASASLVWGSYSWCRQRQHGLFGPLDRLDGPRRAGGDAFNHILKDAVCLPRIRIFPGPHEERHPSEDGVIPLRRRGQHIPPRRCEAERETEELRALGAAKNIGSRKGSLLRFLHLLCRTLTIWILRPTRDRERIRIPTIHGSLRVLHLRHGGRDREIEIRVQTTHQRLFACRTDVECEIALR